MLLVPFSLSLHHLSGVNAISKEVTGPNAVVKHSLLPDRQIESPPKRPKSAEGKTSANEQVKVYSISKGSSQLCYTNSNLENVTSVLPTTERLYVLADSQII